VSRTRHPRTESRGFCADAGSHFASQDDPGRDGYGLDDRIDTPRRQFLWDIEATDESGPALVVGNPGELIVIASDGAGQSAIAMPETGLLIGTDVAKVYWRELSKARHVIHGDASGQPARTNGSVSKWVRDKLIGARDFLVRR
jgi:hypothetical protein